MNTIQKLVAAFAIDIAVFLSWVYVDRVVVESAFRPIAAWDSIYIYHYAMGVGFTTMFVSIGLIFLLTTGMKLASFALSITGIALMKLGPADFLYYRLFGQVVPQQMEWLDDNQAMVQSQIAVDRMERAGVDLSPYVTDVGLGLAIILITTIILVGWMVIFTHYMRAE